MLALLAAVCATPAPRAPPVAVPGSAPGGQRRSAAPIPGAAGLAPGGPRPGRGPAPAKGDDDLKGAESYYWPGYYGYYPYAYGYGYPHAYGYYPYGYYLG